jgi:hypothetical protein
MVLGQCSGCWKLPIHHQDSFSPFPVSLYSSSTLWMSSHHDCRDRCFLHYQSSLAKDWCDYEIHLESLRVFMHHLGYPTRAYSFSSSECCHTRCKILLPDRVSLFSDVSLRVKMIHRGKVNIRDHRKSKLDLHHTSVLPAYCLRWRWVLWYF